MINEEFKFISEETNHKEDEDIPYIWLICKGVSSVILVVLAILLLIPIAVTGLELVYNNFFDIRDKDIYLINDLPRCIFTCVTGCISFYILKSKLAYTIWIFEIRKILKNKEKAA